MMDQPWMFFRVVADFHRPAQVFGFVLHKIGGHRNDWEYEHHNGYSNGSVGLSSVIESGEA